MMSRERIRLYEVSITSHFSAAHHLNNYQGSCEAQHGHNWQVEVVVSGDKLDDTGILMDFKVLKKNVSEIMDSLDHVDLNTLEPFQSINPTSENLACYIYRQIADMISDTGCAVSRVMVHETPGSVATYFEAAK